ncbi:hypothetical protein RFI_06673, partial [Reticulomyxa filosa]
TQHNQVNSLWFNNMSNIVKKGKAWWEQLGVIFQVFHLICSILGFCLIVCFWWNMLVEFVISCITTSSDGSYFGFLAFFFIIHVVSWFCKRFYQASILFVFNIGDQYRTPIVVLWRFLNFLLCLMFTVILSTYSKIPVTDTLFWQLLLRLMIVTGLVWGFMYTGCVIVCTLYTLYLLKAKRELLRYVRLESTDIGGKPFSWLELFLVVHKNRDTRKWTIFKSIYVPVVLLSGLLCIFIGWGTGANFIVFVGLVMCTYYLCIFGRQGKWNALYFLWSGKQYYSFNDHHESWKHAKEREKSQESQAGVIPIAVGNKKQKGPQKARSDSAIVIPETQRISNSANDEFFLLRIYLYFVMHLRFGLIFNLH